MAWLSKRGSVYYIKYWLGPKRRKISTGTDSYQIAKEKLRQFEAAQATGEENFLPTKSSVAHVVEGYVRHIRAHHTGKSVQSDIYYLRDTFGPICAELLITSRRIGAMPKRRRKKLGRDKRRKAPVIEAQYFERITTEQIARFISEQVAIRGLSPRTANRYREILVRMFNWAGREFGVRIPLNRNPATAMKKYAEPAPEIEFLTLPQIKNHLDSLSGNLKLQTMVATLIYAGLRREELLWLTLDDLDLSVGGRGVIRVRAKTVAGESWQSKTKKNRAVPISSTLQPCLDKWLLNRKEGTWLFPAPEGGRWDPDNFSSDLRSANRQVGVDYGCLVYRHTFGSHLARKGVSLYQIAKLMGNSPAIAERHYANLVSDELSDSVEFHRNSDASVPAMASQ